MTINPYILQLLRIKAENPLQRTYQFEALAADIQRVTGEKLGVNTLKRFFGLLPVENPSEMTMEIIAQYLGYGSWRELNRIVDGKNSGFNGNDGTIYPTEYPEGHIIEVSYEPNRHLKMQRVADGWCKVTSEKCGKLLKNDLLKVEVVTLGVPFIVKEVLRDGESKGNFTGGIIGGVKEIKV
jgi:hypothetical protein